MLKTETMKRALIACAFVGALALAMSEGSTEGIAGIGKAAHVNVAVFHFHSGDTPPKEIKGMDIIAQLHGKAQFLTISHTTGIKDGDVIMIASDVLRDGGASVEDFGVDCQLTVHVKNDEEVTLAGMCETLFFDVTNKKEVEAKTIIKPTKLAADDWQLIGYDEDDHIAIYADEEVGTE